MATIRIKMPPIPQQYSEEEHIDAVLLQIAQVVAEWPQVGLDLSGQENCEVWILDKSDGWHARVEGNEIVVSTGLCVPDDVKAAMQTVIEWKLGLRD